MTMAIDDLSEIIEVRRTDPIYNCHSYLTKIPIGAIAPFINAFTHPGEVVADFFAGSGMTALAAYSLGRHARLSDISVLGQHIANGYLVEVDDAVFRQAGAQVRDAARRAVGDLYRTLRVSDGAPVDFVRTVWSFTYICPSCGYKWIYFDHANGHIQAGTRCPGCGTGFSRNAWPRTDDEPVQVVVRGSDGKQTEQEVSEFDLQRIAEAEEDARLTQVPSQTIGSEREMYSRSSLGKSGLTETKKFFSPRNAISLLELWRAINQVDDESIKKKLRFCFTAILPRASMRYQWSAKRPLNAQNQTYYIAPVYYEWNVFDLFQRKINAARRAAAHLAELAARSNSPHRAQVAYDIASADDLTHLDNESIDYVFTDPPFGSNIFYSDMNLFHEAWLGAITDHSSEAVIHTTGARKVDSVRRYEEILGNAFREGWRILKPGGYMSVVFGNSKGRVWGSVQRALREVGFDPTPVHVAILDKGQRSVKGLNSGTESVVTADLVLTVRKPAGGSKAQLPLRLVHEDAQELIVRAIDDIPLETTPNPSHVYARVIRDAIRNNIVLDDLHYSDVLIALRNQGYRIDEKTGLLSKKLRSSKPAHCLDRNVTLGK